MRGSVYQFRVRVPADLRHAMGRVDVNRSSGSVPATMAKTIERRSEKSPSPTLSKVYDRNLAAPTKRRSARTMLAHQTSHGSVVE
ncbi:DUF6538 domain-containing protein [Novosphingobium sp. 32-60-15]|uniref:DUF6538 domain-containing protein n=1 Tax=unclassified Novosphingobium TaxID=2644732 RepID=UPI00344B15D5